MLVISDELIQRIEAASKFLDVDSPKTPRTSEVRYWPGGSGYAAVMNHLNHIAELGIHLPKPVYFLIYRILMLRGRLVVGNHDQLFLQILYGHKEVFAENGVYDVTNYVRHFKLDDGIERLRDPHYFVCCGENNILSAINHIPHRVMKPDADGKLRSISCNDASSEVFFDVVIINFENKKDAMLGRLLLP